MRRGGPPAATSTRSPVIAVSGAKAAPLLGAGRDGDPPLEHDQLRRGHAGRAAGSRTRR